MQVKDAIVEAFEELYRNSRIKIKIRNITSEGFLITKSLRQGYCISPTLCKNYLERKRGGVEVARRNANL